MNSKFTVVAAAALLGLAASPAQASFVPVGAAEFAVFHHHHGSHDEAAPHPGDRRPVDVEFNLDHAGVNLGRVLFPSNEASSLHPAHRDTVGEVFTHEIAAHAEHHDDPHDNHHGDVDEHLAIISHHHEPAPDAVPAPAAMWLMAGGLAGFEIARRRKFGA